MLSNNDYEKIGKIERVLKGKERLDKIFNRLNFMNKIPRALLLFIQKVI